MKYSQLQRETDSFIKAFVAVREQWWNIKETHIVA